jgi:hypothetical protein
VGDGDDDQGDEEPGPIARLISDATGRDASQVSVPPRRVHAGRCVRMSAWTQDPDADFEEEVVEG